MSSLETAENLWKNVCFYVVQSRFEYIKWLLEKLRTTEMMQSVFRTQLWPKESEGEVFRSLLWFAFFNDHHCYDENEPQSVLEFLNEFCLQQGGATEAEVKTILIASNDNGFNILHYAILSDRIDHVKVLLATPRQQKILLNESDRRHCWRNPTSGKLYWPEALADRLGYHDIAAFIKLCRENQKKSESQSEPKSEPIVIVGRKTQTCSSLFLALLILFCVYVSLQPFSLFSRVDETHIDSQNPELEEGAFCLNPKSPF